MALSLSISFHWRRSRAPSRPLAIETRFEWSVIAMYSSPRARAASTISSQRGFAVGGRGVHVQVAAQVVQLDQLGQLAFGGPLEFAPRFAQLRRNPGQIERGVDFFLGAPGDESFLVAVERDTRRTR